METPKGAALLRFSFLFIDVYGGKFIRCSPSPNLLWPAPSTYRNRSHFVALDSWNGKAQHLILLCELNSFAGAKYLHGFRADTRRQFHRHNLWADRIDGLEPSMLRIGIRVVKQVNSISGACFPAKHLNEAGTFDGYEVFAPGK